MKNLILILMLLMVPTAVFAQRASARVDTVKIDVPGKPKVYTAVNMVSTKNITQNLLGAKDYSIFFAALKTTHLTETMSCKGPITLFVPHNQAFDKLKPGVWDTLLKPAHKFELINLLTAHAVAGTLLIKDLRKQIKAGKGKATLLTLSGDKINVSADENNNIVLTDNNGNNSIVTGYDYKQLNGVIHSIDSVLIPKYKAI